MLFSNGMYVIPSPNMVYRVCLLLNSCTLQKGDDEDDGVAVQPRLIVRAIHAKWQAQVEKWADYRNLFGLIVFISVFLGVLYAQRGATIAYSVHSTIASVVLPGSSTLQSTDEVHSWLQNLLQVSSWQHADAVVGACSSGGKRGQHMGFRGGTAGGYCCCCCCCCDAAAALDANMLKLRPGRMACAWAMLSQLMLPRYWLAALAA
jgi:hypothetical protein